jgi:hypothetical protein
VGTMHNLLLNMTVRILTIGLETVNSGRAVARGAAVRTEAPAAATWIFAAWYFLQFQQQ